MDTENETGQTGDVYYNTTYEVDTSGIEQRPDEQQEYQISRLAIWQALRRGYFGY